MLGILYALVAFTLLIGGAALAYPGGTWIDREHPGFSFWHNFWCDLLSTTAIDGDANVLGALLARAAFACFAFALYRFWPLSTALAHVRGAGARRTGRFGALCLVAVSLVPAATSELAHGIAVVLSAGAQVVAVALLLAPLLRRGERLSALLAALTLAMAVVCLVQYVWQGCFASGAAPWLAGMQKLTTVALLAFMLRVLARAHRLRITA